MIPLLTHVWIALILRDANNARMVNLAVIAQRDTHNFLIILLIPQNAYNVHQTALTALWVKIKPQCVLFATMDINGIQQLVFASLFNALHQLIMTSIRKDVWTALRVARLVTHTNNALNVTLQTVV